MIKFYTDKNNDNIVYIKNKYYIIYSDDLFNTQLHSTDIKVKYIKKEFNPSHIERIYELLYEK